MGVILDRWCSIDCVSVFSFLIFQFVASTWLLNSCLVNLHLLTDVWAWSLIVILSLCESMLIVVDELFSFAFLWIVSVIESINWSSFLNFFVLCICDLICCCAMFLRRCVDSTSWFGDDTVELTMLAFSALFECWIVDTVSAELLSSLSLIEVVSVSFKSSWKSPSIH